MGRLNRPFMLYVVVVVCLGIMMINRKVLIDEFFKTSLPDGLTDDSAGTSSPETDLLWSSGSTPESSTSRQLVKNTSTSAKQAQPKFYFEFNTLFENESLCHDNPHIVLSVFSAPADFSNRDVLRQTWAKSLEYMGVRVRVVFLLGRQLDWLNQSQIVEEGEKFGDIVQHDYIDSYHNLSLKRLAGSEWQARRCPNVYWTVKADDDVFVNAYRLIEFYHYYRQHNLSGFYCTVFDRSAVLRDGKWKVSTEEYSKTFYPPYCLGLLTICTLNESLRLYEAAKTTKFLWVEDVFTAGILREAAQVGIHSFLEDPPFMALWNLNLKSPINLHASIVLNHNHKKAHRLWFQLAHILSKTYSTSFQSGADV